jgi:RimJ/RimL family protein N-acetyltransferase
MKIEIRKLLPNESISYREMRLECLKNYPEYFTTNYQDEKTKDKLFFQPFIEQSSTGNFVVGAFHNNNLVGISGFVRQESKKTDHGGMIIQVYVTPEYQGRNIGSDITKSTLNEAFKIDGVEQIEIGVVSSNEKAVRIYTNMGFQEYGMQKNFLKIDNMYYDHKMMMIFKNKFAIAS